MPQWTEDAASGVIRDINAAARALLGLDALLPGTTIARWLPDSMRPTPDPETGWVPGILLLHGTSGPRRPVRLWSTADSPSTRLVMVLPPDGGRLTTSDPALLALDASERQFRHMAENVPGALFQYTQHSDGRSRVTYMSPRCLDLWEVPPEAIEADASILWNMVHPDDLPGMAASVAESGATMRPWYWEWRITTPSGRNKWLQGSGRPRRVDAETVAWDSFILDVTERRRADEEQIQLRAQLRQAQQLEAMGRLAGGIAHDVNNMLTVVLGFADSALYSLPADSPVREDLSEILSAAARSAGLTRQLLAFARQQPSQPIVLDAAERLEDSSSLLRQLVGGAVDLAMELEAGTPCVEIDPSQFDQIITNLIINARDATADGGTITVRLHGDADTVVLSVVDTGTGMDDATRARIFEPFFTTKPEGVGTGLGLATVFGIVTERGGTVAVESTIGVGSTFTVRLPRSTRAVTANGQTAEPTTAELPSNVLVCEDDAQLLRILRQVLERRGLQVQTAATPDEALAHALQSPPDLLITDIITGGRGGMALAEQLRAAQPKLPVVYITGYIADELARRTLATGSEQVLRKPFRGAELIRMVGRAWAARER